MSIKETVDRIMADKKMTRAEYEQFFLQIMDDTKIDAEENEQITRLRELIEKKEIKVE